MRKPGATPTSVVPELYHVNKRSLESKPLNHDFEKDKEAYHEHGIDTQQDIVYLLSFCHELFVAVRVADFLHWHDSKQCDDNTHNSCYKWHDEIRT